MIKIGIVDDHILILNGLEHILRDQNIVQIVFTADSGASLLDKLNHIVPDVLLLDIELPDISGVELCTAIQKIHPDVYIIALTNHDEVAWVRKMIRGGAKGYLLKGTDKTLSLNIRLGLYL